MSHDARGRTRRIDAPPQHAEAVRTPNRGRNGRRKPQLAATAKGPHAALTGQTTVGRFCPSQLSLFPALASLLPAPTTISVVRLDAVPSHGGNYRSRRGRLPLLRAPVRRPARVCCTATRKARARNDSKQQREQAVWWECLIRLPARRPRESVSSGRTTGDRSTSLLPACPYVQADHDPRPTGK